jgi:hypothetical protein
MSDQTKAYEPRPKPTPEERLALHREKAVEAEHAVRDYLDAQRRRMQNMQRLRALRRKAEISTTQASDLLE